MGLAAAALVGALTLAACGNSGDNSGGSGSGGGGGSAAPSSDLKVGMAYDIGGRGDKSFNDSAAVGLDKAKTDLGISADNVKELSARANETDTDRATRLELLAKGGFDPIIAVGFAYAPALKTVAPKYPDVHFGIVDATPDDVKGPNIDQPDLRRGAGLVPGRRGGGAEDHLRHGRLRRRVQRAADRQVRGRLQGRGRGRPSRASRWSASTCPPRSRAAPASTTRPRARSRPRACTTAAPTSSTRRPAARGSGVFKAAAAANKKAIGVDSDQYLTADPSVQKTIITSMIKSVNVAVLDFITSAKDGKFTAGQKVFDLKVDGVGYATSGGAVDDIKTKLDVLQEADRRRRDQGSDHRLLTVRV